MPETRGCFNQCPIIQANIIFKACDVTGTLNMSRLICIVHRDQCSLHKFVHGFSLSTKSFHLLMMECSYPFTHSGELCPPFSKNCFHRDAVVGEHPSFPAIALPERSGSARSSCLICSAIRLSSCPLLRDRLVSSLTTLPCPVSTFPCPLDTWTVDTFTLCPLSNL